MKTRRCQQKKKRSKIDGESDSSGITDIFRAKISSIDFKEGVKKVYNIIPESCSTEVVLNYDVKCEVMKLASAIDIDSIHSHQLKFVKNSNGCFITRFYDLCLSSRCLP